MFHRKKILTKFFSELLSKIIETVTLEEYMQFHGTDQISNKWWPSEHVSGRQRPMLGI
jgi:hypothetical protein